MNFSFVPNQGLMVDGRYITEFDVKVNRIFYYIEEDESKKNRMEYELVAKMFDGTELPPRRLITYHILLCGRRLWMPD